MQGLGTVDSPYLISTPSDLQAINNNLSAYYELANNIDMTGVTFTPIGRVYPFFQGHLDGKGYKITNLRIVDTIEYTGFIARTNGGDIKNIGLENIYIESNNHHVGGLLALNSISNFISNCWVTGTVKQTSISKLYCGGFIGRNYGNVDNCYSDCTVIGGDSVGGFSGVINYAGTTVKNCYSKSIVSGTKNVGAFFGTTDGNVVFENNFYYNQLATVSQIARTGVTGKTSAEMQTQSTYTNWDFTNTWYMDGYPKLKLFASGVIFPNIGTITVDSYIQPFFTNFGKSIKSTKQINSYANTIQSVSKRHTATIRSIDGNLSQIDSNATQSHRTVKSSKQDVVSYMSPIYSTVYRESKTIKRLIATVSHLEGSVSVQIPMNINGAYAYTSVIENPSMTSQSYSLSRSSYVENPSYMEVI